MIVEHRARRRRGGARIGLGGKHAQALTSAAEISARPWIEGAHLAFQRERAEAPIEPGLLA